MFQNKIFDRYEDSLKDLDTRIKAADKVSDKNLIVQLLRLKSSVLKDQLKASMGHLVNNNEKQDLNDAITNLAVTAWEEDHGKVQ